MFNNYLIYFFRLCGIFFLNITDVDFGKDVDIILVTPRFFSNRGCFVIRKHVFLLKCFGFV